MTPDHPKVKEKKIGDSSTQLLHPFIWILRIVREIEGNAG